MFVSFRMQELRAWETKINSWGYKPLFCSASRNSGLSSLVDILANKTSVIIGPSGVGKSSVINALGDVVGVNTWTRYKDGDIDSSDIEVVSHRGAASFHVVLQSSWFKHLE